MARRILAAERRDGRWRPTELVQESVSAPARLAQRPLAEPGALLHDHRAHDAASPCRCGARAARDQAWRGHRRGTDRGRGHSGAEPGAST